MKSAIHPAALLEASDAIEYYNREVVGLGDDFFEEIRATIKRMEESPRQFSRLSGSARRAKLNRFSYGVVYLIQQERIWIVAVMHLKRRPGYWKIRLP
jgi:toxin ParE1/3/4